MIIIRNIILFAILVVITCTDIKRQEIDNEPIIIGMVFITMISICNLNSVSIKSSIIGFLMGGILFIILSFWGMGGGDIKLMSMIGFFLGWKLTIMTMYFSFILGAIMGGLLILIKGKKVKESIAFGPAISLATVIVIIFGQSILWNSEILWYLR